MGWFCSECGKDNTDLTICYDRINEGTICLCKSCWKVWRVE
jgi:hypothetical protein